eukprot:CAMPEP_0171307504 /NCGR_PEP_ID=MMETSP0816-20121228/17520_1 /TAXON_ID=420281 /ORGANISM="Proboscia inermis, Strain CCAP1064/1" /LENGTH=255 /DNA_ID=CAMNT_0011789695 /DNA_START=39 /DNA_END=806 /DNA_ORIENTATION=+
MIFALGWFIWHIYKWRGQTRSNKFHNRGKDINNSSSNMLGYGGVSDVHLRFSRTAQEIRDHRTQLVLVLAGLRGAVSLALVENVPIYNTMTEEGCEYKPLLKGMTSGAIIFTTFIFGGGAFYIFPLLGIKPEGSKPSQTSNIESPRVVHGLPRINVELAKPNFANIHRMRSPVDTEQKPFSIKSVTDHNNENTMGVVNYNAPYLVNVADVNENSNLSSNAAGTTFTPVTTIKPSFSGDASDHGRKIIIDKVLNMH